MSRACCCEFLSKIGKKVLCVLFFVNFALPSFSQDNWEGPDFTPTEYYEALTALRSSEEMMEIYKGNRAIIKLNLEKSVKILSTLPYGETAQVAYETLNEEIQNIEFYIANDVTKIRAWYVIELLKLIGACSNQGDMEALENILRRLKDILEYVYSSNPESDEYRAIYEASADAVKRAASRNYPRNFCMNHGGDVNLSIPPWNEKGTLEKSFGNEDENKPNYPSAIKAKKSDYQEAYEMGLSWIDVVKERMEKMAFGQPELIDAFMEWEFNRVIFNSNRKEPAVIWALGLPGTGKDTHLKAYINAIHGDTENAYNDHVYTFPRCRDTTDLWKVLGSATGFKGSGKLSQLVKFLVKHSGGKYYIKNIEPKTGEKSQEVHINPEWNEGDILPGYESPDSGVLFVDELHNWSKEAKDLLVKILLEKGYVDINTPGEGVDKVQVPINIYLASNDLIHLVASRDKSGARVGNVQSYEDLLAHHQRNHQDYDHMKAELLRSNKKIWTTTPDFKAGYSEEFLRRVPNRGMILMRPTSPEALRSILRYNMDENIVGRFQKAQKYLGELEIQYEDSLIEAMAKYRHNPETAAGDAKSNVIAMAQLPILKAIKDEKLKDEGKAVVWNLNLEENDDGTFKLVIKITDKKTSKEVKTVELLIDDSLALKRPEPLSDEEIQEILKLEGKLNSEVMGVGHISGSLQEAVLDIEDGKNSDKEHKAKTFMFLGISSTGKTELAKALNRNHFSDYDDLPTIDFNNIHTERDVQSKIFGLEDRDLSPFAAEYDKRGGNGVFLLDEVANIRDPNVLTPLYSLMREPVVTDFNDNRARSMKNVTLILTGNAGEEIYDAVPRDLPERVQRAAAQEICKKAIANPLLKRAILRRHFREAFINRIGEDNIHFFCPLDYESVRTLLQLKLTKALNNIATEKGRRVYDVRFLNEQERDKIIDVLDEHAFKIWEQGASIDHFVDQFTKKLQSLLKRNLIASGETVALAFDSVEFKEIDGSYFSTINLNVFTNKNDQPLLLELEGKKVVKEAKSKVASYFQTAIHEAGHSILREMLFGGDFKSTKISIIPGVTEIAGSPVYYAGVASTDMEHRPMFTREYIISEMAALIGGGEAQRIVNYGNRGSAGHSNDLERANAIATELIVSFRLDEEWGFAGRSSNETVKEYIDRLSDNEKEKLHTRVAELLKEAQQVAHDALALSLNQLVKLGSQLAKDGEMDKEALSEFYSKNPVLDYWSVKSEDRSKRSAYYETVKAETQAESLHRELEMVPAVKSIFPKEEEAANLDEIIASRKAKALENVKAMDDKFLLDKKETALTKKAKTYSGSAKKSQVCESKLAG